MTTIGIVLAAGKGTRMKSDLPKVLHRLAGRPLVLHAIAAGRAAGIDRFVVVVGHEAALVEASVRGELGERASFVVQPQQNGTGHAVACALPALADFDGSVVILSGDVPGLRAGTLRDLMDACEASPSGLAFLSFRPADAAGYGRVVRDPEGRPRCIREHADASPEERRIGECNAGIYCVRAELLRTELPRLGSSNAQGEIYLTDLVERVAPRGEVIALEVDPLEVAGVNTPEQLSRLESVLRGRP